MADGHDTEFTGEPGRTRWTQDAMAVLASVRGGSARFRNDVVDQTGLHRTIAGRCVADLIGLGLLRETTSGPSTGGRPPRELAFAADAGFYLVADLGATSVDVATTDLDGRVLDHVAADIDIEAGPDPVLATVERLFDETLNRTHLRGAAPWGVGIGVPGPVDFGSGWVVAPPIMPGWEGYPIRDRLAAVYHCPAWVDNDVNLMVLGEWRLGAAQGFEDVVFVKIGTGIGAGIVAGGRLQRGAKGAAGDIGHIRITEEREAVCRCGNIGCLEAVAGGAAIAASGSRVARAGGSPQLEATLAVRRHLTAEDVGRAAEHGDAAAIRLLRDAGRAVGETLAAVVNVLNPSIVVIGGGVARSGDHLLASVREAVYGRSLPMATRDLRIVRSELDDRAGVTGAGAMVAAELFAPARLATWIEAGSPVGGRRGRPASRGQG